MNANTADRGPDWVFDVNECSDTALHAAANFDTILDRLRADLVYHQGESERITRENLDIDTADEGDYSIEADTEESYHAGRVSALFDAINILLGREVKLYSETEG